MSEPYVVTIDGPAASGKTSVSRDLANLFGWKWVSTGSFYRGLALVCLKEKVDLDSSGEIDGKKIVAIAQSNIWSVEMTPMETMVMYKGQRVTMESMQEEIGMYASKISQDPEVRKALLPLQRACATTDNVLVAEGRDCGTVVFPNAILKLYLTASSDSRALRRSLEHSGSFDMLKDLQAQRDEQDAARAHAPMQVPPGAEVIDSSTMQRDAVVKRATELVMVTLKAKNLNHLIKNRKI